MVYNYGRLRGIGFPSGLLIMAFIVGGSSDSWRSVLEVEKCRVDEGWIEQNPMLVVSPLLIKSCLVSSSITCVLLLIRDCEVYELGFKNVASFWIARLIISSSDNYLGIIFLEYFLCFLI
jgi:hypothetical protein